MEAAQSLQELPLQKLLAEFSSNEICGLSQEQVAKNQAQFGKNVLSKAPPPKLLIQILDALKEPMLLLLLFASFLALGVNLYEFFMGRESNFLECVGIFIAIFLSVLITLVMENKSQKAFEALNKITQGNLIKVLRDGHIKLIPQEEIVVGDILFLESGDKIPSDGLILQSQDLMCDESALSGESMPVYKSTMQNSQNKLYRGCFVTQGSAKVLCVSVGDKTEFGKIAQALNQTLKTSTPLQEKLQRLSGKITLFGIIAAALAFVIQVIFFVLGDRADFENISAAFISSVVLIVAAVPEGLPTIVAVSLALNVIKMSKQNALVKKLIACETIGCVNIICSDKTGTLTQNKMRVEHCFVRDKKAQEINQNKETLEMMFLNFSLNSTAELAQDSSFIGNPTECALLAYLKNLGYNYHQYRQNYAITHTFPFSPQTKYMSSLVALDKENLLLSKGAPEKILELCGDFKSNDLKIDFDSINQQISALQQQAYRIIAFAHKKINNPVNFSRETLESQMIFDGFVAISDPLREEVYEAVTLCKEAGIEVKILTGDNLQTAKAISEKLHLLEKDTLVLEAKDLENLNPQEFLAILPKVRVIARSTPMTKMQVVQALKSQGNVVALSGDGINDAPALKNADVGIAMGISGTEVTKEASDIVLLNDSFATIIKAIEWGRGIYQNFQRFIQFQLAVNFSSVMIVLVVVIFGFSAPFSALQLLWVNLIMDGPPALSLGLEPISQNLLKQKPIKRNSNIITKEMLGLIVICGTFITLVCLGQYFGNFLNATPEEQGSVLFALFVMFQLFNAFNARELQHQSIFKSFNKNPLMLWIFALAFGLQILIVQFGGDAFKTTPLSLVMWIKIIVVSLSVIIVGELMRWFFRQQDSKEKSIL